MPIEGILQPDIVPVDDEIRLRRYDGIHGFALSWYQDPELVWLVDGVREPYDREKLDRMYRYLDAHGELYFIEIMQDGVFLPIGDVTFWPDDMPIVIGDAAWRGRGVGRQVIAALVQRARELGWERLRVAEIYDWNEASRRCFEHAGFTACEKTEKGMSYQMRLR